MSQDQAALSESALERIELKIAYLESAYQQLSDVVYRQQREIEVLQARLAASQRLLEALKSEAAPGFPDDERPPHY